MEEMEKRSDRHIRDLVAHTAFKGLDANEIGCARISVMAGAIAPFGGPNTDEQDQLSPGRHIRLATHGRSIQTCNARPVHTHTDVPTTDVRLLIRSPRRRGRAERTALRGQSAFAVLRLMTI